MHMAMMQGMMGMNPAAMQMAMMGMPGMPPIPGIPPPYMHGMRPPHMMFGVGATGGSKKRRREGDQGGDSGAEKPANDAGDDGGGSSSSSSSSDSSDSESNNGIPSHPMVAMAGMWPGPHPGAPWHATRVPPNGPMDLEGFLRANPVDAEAADQLRALPPHLQQAVIRRGPVSNTGNPSAVLLARVRDAESGEGIGGLAPSGSLPGPPPGPPPEDDKPARKSAKATIENMIKDYRLSAGCAWMLRSLPPDKQKLASRIDPAGQADPSGYVAEQMKLIV